MVSFGCYRCARTDGTVAAAPCTERRLSDALKRVFLIAFVLIATCALSCTVITSAYAADAPSAEHRTVRIGYFAFDGYHMQSEDGVRSGYGYDLIQYLARYNNWDVQYIGYDKSWSEVQQMLADGQIDLLTSVQKTPAREAEFLFSDENVGTSSIMLTVKSGNMAYTAGDYAGYNGMRVGMIKNNSRNDTFAAFAAEKGFTYTAVFFNSNDELTLALQDGTSIDAAVTSTLRSTSNEWKLDEFGPSPFYVMVGKNDTELIAQVNYAIAQLDMDMPSWRTELTKKYYTTDSGDELAFSADERTYIEKLKADGIVFKVVMNPDNAPYSYRDADGNMQGTIPEIFDVVAQRAGITYTILDTPTKKDYYDAIYSGEADLVADSVMDTYHAESAGYKLCDSYLTVTVSQLSLRNRNQSIETVCMPEDVAAAIDNIGRSDSDTNKKFVTLDTVQDCVNAVLNGTYDSAYLFTDTARHYASDDARNRLVTLSIRDYSPDISIAVSDRLDFQLLSLLDRSGHSVPQLADDLLQEQASESNRRTTSFLSTLYDNPWPFIVTALIIGVLLVGFIFRNRAAKLERKRNLALEQKDRELSKALDIAEKATSTEQMFLSNMSHDMRTPLNGIIGFTDLALETDDAAKRQEFLDKIKFSGQLMLDLVNDVLDLSKIESGKMELRPEMFETRELFDAVVSSVTLMADERGVKLEATLDSGYPRFILADRLSLQQIALNLLSNAIKFTQSGGTVRFEISRLENSEDACNTLLVVSDNGIGMSQGFQDRMFEPFAQEHQSGSTDVRGTGLGLSIVSRVIALMGGSMQVSSALGKGSMFSVHLPIEIVDMDTACPDRGRESQRRSIRGRRILLCEDNDLNAEIAKTILHERGGAEVERAENGKCGVNMFEASEPGYYDAILMDVRMPVMDGQQATKTIRDLNRTDAASIPIIAMTADAFEEDARNCKAAGMNAHIAKPVDPGKLIETLERYIAARDENQ